MNNKQLGLQQVEQKAGDELKNKRLNSLEIDDSIWSWRTASLESPAGRRLVGTVYTTQRQTD